MEEKLQHSKLSSGTSLSLVDEDVHIDPTKANRSISVRGIPVGTKAEDLVIHFQRKRNGGGDVDDIVMNKRGSAVVTFDKAEGKVSVAECGLIIRLRPSFCQNYCFSFVLRNEMLYDNYICVQNESANAN